MSLETYMDVKAQILNVLKYTGEIGRISDTCQLSGFQTVRILEIFDCLDYFINKIYL